MADREKKKKRAYLDDFEKDLNGNYRYRGAHYRYAGEIPRGKALARLWALCGGGAALTVAAGVLPGATARAPLYLELPYMAALVLALYAVVVTGACNARRRPDAGLHPRADRAKIALFVCGLCRLVRRGRCGTGDGGVCGWRTTA